MCHDVSDVGVVAVPFPVSLHTPEDGNMIIWCYEDELVRSVKYKIAVLKGIPVSNQTLLLNEQTLSNDITLHSCNVRTNSMLVLQVSGSNRPVKLRAASINPSLSIINFSISPFIQAVSYEIPVLPCEVTLPAQVAQLLIVSDLTGNSFSEFIRYLYTGTIMVTIGKQQIFSHLTLYNFQQNLHQCYVHSVKCSPLQAYKS